MFEAIVASEQWLQPEKLSCASEIILNSCFSCSGAKKGYLLGIQQHKREEELPLTIDVHK